MADDPGEEEFKRLFRAEDYFRVPPEYLLDTWKMDLRNTAIQHMENLYPRTNQAFDHLIPYKAMFYFDRWCSTRDYFPNALQEDTKNRELFVICCLTISMKLRDNSFNLKNFLESENILYSVINVRHMELKIDEEFKGPIEIVTPFDFVRFFQPYFVMSLDMSVFRELIYRSQRDIEFTAYRASVVALSAMLAVSTEMASVEHRDSVLKSLTYKFKQLLPVKDEIEKCRTRLMQLHNDENPDDDLPAGPPAGPVTSSAQSTNLEPGQTSVFIDDPPQDSGQLPLGGQNADPNNVLNNEPTEPLDHGNDIEEGSRHDIEEGSHDDGEDNERGNIITRMILKLNNMTRRELLISVIDALVICLVISIKVQLMDWFFCIKFLELLKICKIELFREDHCHFHGFVKCVIPRLWLATFGLLLQIYLIFTWSRDVSTSAREAGYSGLIPKKDNRIYIPSKTKIFFAVLYVLSLIVLSRECILDSIQVYRQRMH